MKSHIKSNHKDLSENIVFENDNVIIIEYPNGTATYDKHNGMLMSWHGEEYKENV